MDVPGLADLARRPHRRYNPLKGEWILVSPQRTARPWQGQVEDRPPDDRLRHDPDCYLCPGNLRASGARNPQYEGTFVYDNDFPALLPEGPSVTVDEAGLLLARSERGICRVVCFSPRHDLTLAEMAPADLRRVVDAWVEQTEDLGGRPYVGYVQVFENRGAMMGASNPHPHGQVWANETIPEEPAREQAAQRRYLEARGSCLLCDYLELELAAGDRLVCENEHFVALVPFWATWPFETMVLSRRHTPSLPDLGGAERDALASLLKRLTTRYDNLFRTSFPYTMGFHQAPTDDSLDLTSRTERTCAERGQEVRSFHPEWHLHAHFYPPLLRSATIRKFMVGYEMLANAQRDLTAEQAADRLRGLSEVHYRSGG